MVLLEEYLKYLHEQDTTAYGKFKNTFVGKNLHTGVTSSFWFGLAVTPAVILAWRSAGFAFSKSIRKCGGVLASRKPGFKVCVSKEKIKALQQKMVIAKGLISKCSSSKNPDACKQKFELEVEKCKNRIQIEENKIKQVLGEQVLAKIGAGATKVAAGAAGFGIMIGAGMVADKAMNLTLRTAQALYSSASRKCGVYKKEGPERNLCISKIKLDSLNKQLGTYNRWLTTCGKHKNPEECKQKISNKIAKVTRNIQIQNDNIKAYQNELNIAKREEEFKRSMNVKK